MEKNIKDVLSELKTKFLMNRDIQSKFSKGLLLVLTGKFTGSFLFKLGENRFSYEDFKNQVACTITMSSDVLSSIKDGTISPQRAYLENKIHIIGDYKLAFYFSFLLV